jgi:murein L,D-transpeptidase YafK
MRLRFRSRILLLVLLALAIVAVLFVPRFPEKAKAASQPRQTQQPRAKLQIEVVKSRRTLTLYSHDRILKEYRIGLGSSPIGRKEKQGDRKTPEGMYFICSKNPKSQFHLSLGVSYPNAQDAERGIKQRLITQAQYRAIIRAAKKKTKPPWDTPLGGEIFIHGNGSASDWTWGCIALDDADIEELYRLIPVGTPVVITP